MKPKDREWLKERIELQEDLEYLFLLHWVDYNKNELTRFERACATMLILNLQRKISDRK